jgi:hypothetical protein
VTLACLTGLAPAAAQEPAATEPAVEEEAEKPWSLEVGVDYSSLYMFRGLNLLGESQEVLTPRAILGLGDWSVWTYGYFGKFDGEEGEGDYTETDFGVDYTFGAGSFSLTLGALTYLYTKEVEDGLGYADTYEVYGIASWDVPLAPTVSYYHDVDAVEGGFLSIDVSHSFPAGEKVSIDLSGQLGLDFGYNQPGDPEAGVDASQGDLNHLMVGLDLPWQVNDAVSLHALVQRFVALDIADDLGQPDETVVTVGGTVTW